MSRKWIVMGIVTIGGLACAIAILNALLAEPAPPLPTLLQKVSATGGDWTRVCFQDVRLRQSSDQPSEWDFNLRLESIYPIGSPEARLRADLREAGFIEVDPCAGQSGVRAATFGQREVGLFKHAAVATVYWASDKSQRLTWLKGYIAFRL